MYEIVFSDEALKYISTVTKKERAQIKKRLFSKFLITKIPDS